MASGDEFQAAQSLLDMGKIQGYEDLHTFSSKYGISASVLQTLLANGINSLFVLQMLQPGDLESLGLPLGQLRLLQAALRANTIPIPDEPQQQAVTEPAPVAQDASAGAQHCPGGARRLLGLDREGEKIDYFRIKSHVTPLNKESETQEKFELPDGSLFLPKGIEPTTRVKLENVTALQYVEASMRIMGKLILSGKLGNMEQVLQYAGYTAMIARLGQKKDWRSVLRFDDGYREAQAADNLAWGTDLRDLRDLHLEARSTTKHDASKQINKNGGKHEKKKGYDKRSSGSTEKTESIGEWRLCRDFNNSSCSRAVCGFKHFCSKCGSSSHGSVGHPN